MRYGPQGAERACRVVEVVTTDIATLTILTTRYLATNLPHPDARHEDGAPFALAVVAEILLLFGLCKWVEQRHLQFEQGTGRAGLIVRAVQVIPQHWSLFFCTFPSTSTCCRIWFPTGTQTTDGTPSEVTEPAAFTDSNTILAQVRGKWRPIRQPTVPGVLAADASSGA